MDGGAAEGKPGSPVVCEPVQTHADQGLPDAQARKTQFLLEIKDRLWFTSETKAAWGELGTWHVPEGTLPFRKRLRLCLESQRASACVSGLRRSGMMSSMQAGSGGAAQGVLGIS